MNLLEKYAAKLPDSYKNFIASYHDGFAMDGVALLGDPEYLYRIDLFGKHQLHEWIEDDSIHTFLAEYLGELIKQIRDHFKGGCTLDENDQVISLDRLENSFVIGDANGDLMYLDFNDGGTVWLFYSDGGDVLKLADSFDELQKRIENGSS